MTTFRDLVLRLMETGPFDQVQLAERLGVTQSTVSRWLKGADPKLAGRNSVEALARELLVLEARAERRSTIPIMGRIGAGAEIDAGVEQVPPEGYYEAEAVIPLPPYAIGFEVVGDSMVPRYGPGDVVVCPRDGTPFERIPDGEEAAVLTADGRRFLKFALRTAVPNIYNLISVNATASPILGVELTWAADVLTVVRARQWSRVTHDDRRRLSIKVSTKRGR